MSLGIVGVSGFLQDKPAATTNQCYFPREHRLNYISSSLVLSETRSLLVKASLELLALSFLPSKRWDLKSALPHLSDYGSSFFEDCRFVYKFTYSLRCACNSLMNASGIVPSSADSCPTRVSPAEAARLFRLSHWNQAFCLGV